jgi:hypothetical protein
MSLTKTDAKQRAAELLKIVPIGQGMENQDDVRMDSAYDEIYAKLQINGTAVWDSTGTMPDEVDSDFIYLMADSQIDLYPVSDNLYARIKNRVGPDGITALNSIRRQLGDIYEDLDRPTDY